MGNDVTDEQAKWRDDAIMRSQSTSLIERRVRMALRHGNSRAALPMAASHLPKWSKEKVNGVDLARQDVVA